MHKFDENTIVTDFIKNLLYNFWVPLFDTVNDTDYIVKDFCYIYNNNIIKCTKSGYIKSDDNTAEYVLQGIYKFGGKYRKLSDNFIANVSRYDTTLHERLGKFVRMYSDLTGIDLRRYYNYVSNHFIQNTMVISSPQLNGYTVTDEFTDDVKVYVVPIRFNRKYTLAVDCSTAVYVAPIFLSKDRKVTITDATTGEKETVTEKFLQASNLIKKFDKLSFQIPQTVEIKCNTKLEELYYKYEKNLYLMIQLPLYNESSVVLLEGDYTNNDCTKVIETTQAHRIPTHLLNNCLSTSPSLLSLNVRLNIPFSNKLIEYLFNNVVDDTSALYDVTISNILKSLPQLSQYSYIDGVWNDMTRISIYNFVRDNLGTMNLRDCDGYFDKIVEKGILGNKYIGGEL